MAFGAELVGLACQQLRKRVGTCPPPLLDSASPLSPPLPRLLFTLPAHRLRDDGAGCGVGPQDGRHQQKMGKSRASNI
eukprot:scaffold51241_cov16-Tisochrysis_lutea.AAC.1